MSLLLKERLVEDLEVNDVTDSEAFSVVRSKSLTSYPLATPELSCQNTVILLSAASSSVLLSLIRVVRLGSEKYQKYSLMFSFGGKT